jgi:ELWxxDGT repeat protein
MKNRLRSVSFETLERRELLAAELISSGTPLGKPTEFVAAEIGEQTIFLNRDRDHGREVWTTNGTSPGTRLLKDVTPGHDSSRITEMASYGDQAVFINEREFAFEIWRTDGTPDQTNLIRSIPREPYQRLTIEAANTNGFYLLDAARNLYFLGNDSSEITTLNQEPSRLAFYGHASHSRIAFKEIIGSVTNRVYVSDGTSEGTTLVSGADWLETANYNRVSVGATDNYIYYRDSDPDGGRLFRISDDGIATRVGGEEMDLFGSTELHEVGQELVVSNNRDLWHLQDGLIAKRITSRYDGFLLAGDSDDLLYSRDGFFNLTTELWSYNVNSGQTAEVQNAPAFLVEYGLRQEGKLVLGAIATESGNQLIAYNPDTNSQVVLKSLSSRERVTSSHSSGSFFFLKISDGATGTLMLSRHLVTQDTILPLFQTETTDRLGSGFQADSSGTSVSGMIEDQVGARLVRLNLETGAFSTLSRYVQSQDLINLDTPQANFFSIEPIFGLDETRFAYYGTDYIVLSDGTVDGTRSISANLSGLFGPDGSGIQVPHLITGGTDTYFETDFTSETVRVITGDEEAPVVSFVPGNTSFGPTPNGTVSFVGPDVLLNDGNVTSLLVANYRDKFIERSADAETGPHDVLELRGVNGDYVSDGTVAGTGRVDSRERIQQGYPLANSVGSILSSRKAKYAFVTFDEGRQPVVERPTSSRLELFFPGDRSESIDTVSRIHRGWVATGPADAPQEGSHAVWVWMDDEPAPRLLGMSPTDQAIHVTSEAYYVSDQVFDSKVNYDLLAFSGGDEATSFFSLVDLPGTQGVATILGTSSTDEVFVHARTQGTNGHNAIYRWNGTSDGLTPLDAINDTIEQQGLFIRDSQDALLGTRIKLAELPHYYLLQVENEFYRIPRSERTESLVGPNVTIEVTQAGVTASAAGSQAGITGGDNGELLTLDATDTTGEIAISVVDAKAIPINGLTVRVPVEAEISLSLPDINDPIRYEIDDDELTVAIGGRKLRVLHAGDVSVRETSQPAESEARLHREFVVHGKSAQVRATELASDVGVAVENDLLTDIHFSDPIESLRLFSMDEQQHVALPVLPSVNQVQLFSGGPQGHRWSTSVGDGALPQITDVIDDATGRMILATSGDTEIHFDLSASPLHNPVRSVDTDSNNEVTPNDALVVINHLAAKEGYRVTRSDYFPDVSGDGEISPSDILDVLNYLAANQASGEQIANRNDVVLSDWLDDEEEDENAIHELRR